MDTYANVLLAAGKGGRMRSALPKVLHPLVGVPMLAHVLKAIEAIPSTSTFAPLVATTTAARRPIVVLGYEAAQVEAVFGERCLYAMQEQQLGTGHAVLAAREVVDALDPLPQTVLVCYGDTPLVSSEVLAHVLVEHLASRATVTFMTTVTDQPSDFGRVVRDADGQVSEIIKLELATEEQRSIREVNSGVYCRVQLADAERVLRRRILDRHMYAGVTIIDPATTYVDEGVEIGMDTIILPGTMITGNTRIGSECRIGPGTSIHESTIGDRCKVRNSIVEESTFEDDVRFGPWSRCRNGTYLARGVGIGNFGEIRGSFLGPKTEMYHFSFIGDATIGEHVNIGAGAITCNYDGVRKNSTVIGDGAFIGSDTMLVAPVTIGEGAKTGAGSVVRHDVPPGAVVVGVPARILHMRTPQPQPDESPTTEGSEKE